MREAAQDRLADRRPHGAGPVPHRGQQEDHQPVPYRQQPQQGSSDHERRSGEAQSGLRSQLLGPSGS